MHYRYLFKIRPANALGGKDKPSHQIAACEGSDIYIGFKSV